MSKAHAYAATSKASSMAPITISRRELRSNDVNIEIAMALVGIPEKPHPSPSVASLIGVRRSLAGSLVGGIKETQEMLDFFAENGVLAETETIPMQEIETAFARMVKNDVKYRFVVDMKSLKVNV